MRPTNLSPKTTSAYLNNNRVTQMSSTGLFLRVATILVFAGFLITIPYSGSSASIIRKVDKKDSSVVSRDKIPTAGVSVELGERVSPSLRESFNPLLLPVPQSSEGIATFADDCTTPKTDFVVGDTVCVVASGVPLSSFPFFRRHLAWATTDSTVVRSTAITTDPQTDTLLITATTLINGQAIDNRGTWELVVRNPFFFFPEARAKFTVTDPVRPTADLSVDTTLTPSSVGAGSQTIFGLQVTNYGPNSSTNVTLTDAVPANTTFVSFVQTSGPAFTCNNPTSGGPGTSTCTIATLDSGAVATFLATYDVNTGVAAGTEITNTADVASVASVTPLVPATDDENTHNNSTSASTTVTSSGGTGSCTLNCPDNINAVANTTEDNQRGAHVTFDPAEPTGTCGAITATPASGSFFPVGTTVVSVTSETGGGSCSFTVTVEDQGTNPPTISCPANREADANDDCEAVVNLGNPSAGGDNVTISVTRSDGKPMYDCDTNGQNCVRKSTDLPFSAGVTTVTWTATTHDSAGNDTGNASCQQTVTVNDVTPPVIAAQDQTVAADANCQAAIPDYSSTVSDNCACSNSDTSENCIGHPHFTVTQSPSPGTMVGPGAHTVHITANDNSSNNGGAGNSTEKDITFTVRDETPPVITCPGNVTTNTDPGTCAAVVNPGSATATDNCDSNPTITGTRSDGQPLTAPYPGGTTTITWRATDDAGNHSECTQTITVEDHEAPVIVCPANVTHGTDPGTCSALVNPGQPTVTDNCDNSPTVTSSRSDGQSMNAPYPKGTTTITWTATDHSGNHASCTQTVTVVDTEAPTITFTGTQSMWPPNHKYHAFQVTDFVASVQDNCDGNIAVSSVVITKVTSDEIENGNGDGNTLNDIVIAADCKSVQLRSEREGNSDGRVYTIFFSVRDAAGNVGTGTTKVVVPHNPGETAVDSGPHYTVMSNCP